MMKRASVTFAVLTLIIGLAFFFVRKAYFVRAEEAFVFPKRSLQSIPSINSFLKHPVRSETEFLKTFPGEWKFEKAKDGRILSIYGGPISRIGRSKKEMLKLTQILAPLLGLPNQQASLQVELEDSGPLSNRYRIPQMLNGKSAGSVFLFVSKREGDVFMINNDFKL